jgi:hypothetical protein
LKVIRREAFATPVKVGLEMVTDVVSPRQDVRVGRVIPKKGKFDEYKPLFDPTYILFW